ncbi:hypothetical protein SAMN05443637_101201 [Pseudonocardia thermophila]|jgi:hypothetical protein|uniref:Uncharacterized protein n=1 Tax=Pseudonocardia thermophila TaxID=1848 RepID=A0A1M6NE13_PSETH|nr:hypothetical protein [Pseudonocardia thermophila]SHJ93957.1 hypothetical protein SAMN05443637_101201 [Pseudonocardia thermophila]
MSEPDRLDQLRPIDPEPPRPPGAPDLDLDVPPPDPEREVLMPEDEDVVDDSNIPEPPD